MARCRSSSSESPKLLHPSGIQMSISILFSVSLSSTIASIPSNPLQLPRQEILSCSQIRFCPKFPLLWNLLSEPLLQVDNQPPSRAVVAGLLRRLHHRPILRLRRLGRCPLCTSGTRCGARWPKMETTSFLGSESSAESPLPRPKRQLTSCSSLDTQSLLPLESKTVVPDASPMRSNATNGDEHKQWPLRSLNVDYTGAGSGSGSRNSGYIQGQAQFWVGGGATTQVMHPDSMGESVNVGKEAAAPAFKAPWAP